MSEVIKADPGYAVLIFKAGENRLPSTVERYPVIGWQACRNPVTVPSPFTHAMITKSFDGHGDKFGLEHPDKRVSTLAFKQGVLLVSEDQFPNEASWRNISEKEHVPHKRPVVPIVPPPVTTPMRPVVSAVAPHTGGSPTDLAPRPAKPTPPPLYRVAGVKTYGVPERGQHYWVMQMVSDDGLPSYDLHFHRTCKTLADRWDQALAKFLLAVGVPELEWSEQLIGKALHLRTHLVGSQTRRIMSVLPMEKILSHYP